MANRATRRSKPRITSRVQGSVQNPYAQRVLMYSNAPFVPTGYGVQTAQLVARMARDQHEVAVACNYGLAGAETSWNNVKLYPMGITNYSDELLRPHSQHWQSGSKLPGLVLTLFDVWALQNPSVAKIPKIAAWTPIDHQPAPPKVVEWLKRSNVFPIAMSRFGEEMMRVDGIDSVYIPHGIEPVFQPTASFADADGEMITGRQLMRISRDAFVVTMNAANKGHTPPRKCWGENLLAFSIFARRHKDAVLYIHSEKSNATAGIDLPSLVKAVGIRDDQIAFVDQYLYRMNMPQVALAAIYSDSDVLLAPSAGEGFGVPTIEAQACGTRVIVSDFSAQPELVGDGWCVAGQPLWDSFQDSFFFTPNVESIVVALEAAYDAERGVSDKAVAFVSQFDADYVYETHWRPTLKAIYEWVPGD